MAQFSTPGRLVFAGPQHNANRKTGKTFFIQPNRSDGTFNVRASAAQDPSQFAHNFLMNFNAKWPKISKDT